MCYFTVYPGGFSFVSSFIFVFSLILFLYKCPPCPDSPLEHFVYTPHIFLCCGLLHKSSYISTINPAPYLPDHFMLCKDYHSCFHRTIHKRSSVWKTWRICVEWKKKLMKILKLRLNFCGLVLGPSTLRMLLTRLEHHFLFSLFPKSLGKYSLFFNIH